MNNQISASGDAEQYFSAARTPPNLKPGDTIGIICPAGFMDSSRMQACVAAFERWGLTVLKGATFYSQSNNYFSGTDEQRRVDLQSMLDNPEVKAVVFGRGGYGTSRIIDQLDFSEFCASPKWLVGFSDITILHSHIVRNFNIATIHGPMASAFLHQSADNNSVTSLKKSLFDDSYVYNIDAHPFNQPGTVRGILVGGNLSILVHAIGTSSDLDWENKILFIEDVGEFNYGVDRMMIQLQRAGRLKKLAGIIVGGFSDSKDTDRPFGQTVYELIRDKFSDVSYPVCFNFPVSHTEKNVALKCGLVHTLNVSTQSVTLELSRY